MSVVIETTIGDLTVDLYLKERPNTCLNFLKLCKIKYYNLCLFHKIEKNFIAQSGDPTGTGRGGESIFSHLYGNQAKYFDSEFKPRLKHEKLGTVSMVNNGNNMNGSQFFFTLGENLTYLDEDHTVFGEVVEGFDILLKLNEAICDGNDRPYQDIRITHTVVLHDPYDDPAGLDIPAASPKPTREQLESGYIAADEEIDDTKGKNAEEIEERIKENEAKARATILEMVGDIPDADVKPPENVLFVCKLNPVTTSEDLEIIFSRFGPIVSCEVIKDQKTGESLQYAFIEFEKEQDCENAYFKMDNVLIDDRRIHVDFSQSVSKMNWNKDNTFSNTKAHKDNVILKNTSKRSDGYDLIFESDVLDTRKKADSQNSKTPEKKYSHFYRKEKGREKYRSRSKSPVRNLQPSKTENFRDRSRSLSPAPKRSKYSKKYYSSDYQTSYHKSYTDKSIKSNFSQKGRKDNIREISPDSHSYKEHSNTHYDRKNDSKNYYKHHDSHRKAYKVSEKNKISTHHQEPSKVSCSYESVSSYREKKKHESKQYLRHHSRKSSSEEDLHQSKIKKSKAFHKKSEKLSDNTLQKHAYSLNKKSHNKTYYRSSSISSSSSSPPQKMSKNHETSSESSDDSSYRKKRKHHEKKKNIYRDLHDWRKHI